MPIRPVKKASDSFERPKTGIDRRFLFNPLRLVLSFSLCLLAGQGLAHAQTITAQITVTNQSPARIQILIELPTATNTLSFRNTYAGILGLGERVEKLSATNGEGQTITARKLAPGEFQSSEKFSRFSYEVNLAEPISPARMSHMSWVSAERGLLMLADLLPQSAGGSPTTRSASVKVNLPNGWTAGSNLKRDGSRYSTDNFESAIFLIGSSVREKSQRRSPFSFSLISSGSWPFSENEALKIAKQILDEHSRVTGFVLNRDAVVMLLPYAGEAGPDTWTAETRGNTVVLLLGSKAGRKSVFAQLGIVLSHELFHLWIPNSLKLEGEYDWFFEGFTLYHALRTDLRLGLISFDVYLKTMASVYDSCRANAGADKLSLIEASERRWTTSSSLVYEKGMLAAFVYDLTLRRLSNCRASLDDVYADLFRLPTTGQGNANETIIKLLTGREGMQSFAQEYIEVAGGISLETPLAPYGIQLQQATTRAGSSRLVVRGDLSESQRKLLGCLGYRK